MSRVVTVLMDLPEKDPSYRYTTEALAHAIDAVDATVRVDVVRTDAIDQLGDAVVIGPGSPYRDAHAAEHVVEDARKRGVPLVGT
jgi:CTP synthase (UTP-ammonia lyase)